MGDLSSYAFLPLSGGDSTLHRGSGEGLAPVLLACAKDASFASLVRLEHEYALRADLDPSWAARPIALSRHNDRWALLLEDPGGEPLDRVLDGPMETPEFLRLAIPLTNAVRQMHERGLIHKNIKPGNILAHPSSGRVWLTGFGIASRMPREHHAPAPPEVIAGTLAYIAPEQTGRMNRSVDSRSDLYSLGIAFYEILTGRLPFIASDAMEWVHCHIARQAAPPDEHAKKIPTVLSSIVMKLLAKTAEDRYQTAAGLAADLRRCLTEWEAGIRVPTFSLGTRDLSDRLLIPEKLYGRTQEIDALRAAFDRVVSRGATELVLVSGYSGVGKSSIVNELHKALVPTRGLFAAGKFDQYQRDIPYSTFARAFQVLVRPILGQGEAELQRWRDRFRDALGPNAALMINLVPEIELIMGEQPPVAPLSPPQTQERFQRVFRQFVAAFARQEHPLVLFLDDLQWLDAASLELFADLATHPDLHDLLLIGAFRDNEVGPAHPLQYTLDVIRKTRTGVDIVITPLTRDDITNLVAETLRCEPDAADPLGQLVHEKTMGNPFFAIQFLEALREEHLLVCDPNEARWQWDLHRIGARRFTDNVVDLMVVRLTRLPADAQKTLKRLACLGHLAATRSLPAILGKPEADVHADLRELVRAGLLLRVDDHYTFAHDRVREAAYALIPRAERAALHLHIGRTLAAHTSPDLRQETAFEIVSQMNRGATLIESQEEREQLAALNLIAGKRAQAATAYASALSYLSAGESLLAPDHWDRRHALAFALAFHRAECAFLTGDPANAEEALAALARRAATPADLTTVACLRIAVSMTTGASERAIQIGLECLQSLGISWSARPTDEEVQSEYAQVRQQLGDREIETLIDLPPMSEPTSCATMDILVAFIPAAHWIDRNLYCLIIGRMTNLGLEHGNDDGSSIAYAYLGTVLGPYFGDYQTGHRFGKLALDLVKKRPLDRFKNRVYAVFGHHISPWMSHLSHGRELVKRAADAAHEAGDLTFEVFSRMNLTTNLLASGEPLEAVQREAERALALAEKSRYGLVVELIAGQLRFIRTLRGLTVGSFCGSDEIRLEQLSDSTPAILACWHWIRALQARFLAGDANSAIVAAEKAAGLLWTSPSFLETAEYHFYAALARASCCDTAPVAARARHMQALHSHHEKITVWAENCPANFSNRAALVSAEIARLEGRDFEAMRLYEAAIRSARDNGFIQNEALSHELASRFYAARDFTAIALSYLRAARDSYMRWGSGRKVRQLENSFPNLAEQPPPPRTGITIGASVEHLDLGTVIKVSQTVSSEIVLEQLIDRLMRTALEHAGAGRGLLLTAHDGLQRIEAEAATVRDTVTVRLRPRTVSATDLPASILHYVVRTRQTVLLDDAAAPNAFSEDPYLSRNPLRSVLCLPLMKQNALIGVLYLENKLAPSVFTPARSAVLALLASQAAIALENAYLYSDLQRANADLQQENSERRRVEAALRQSEEQWRDVFENNPTMYFMVDAAGQILAVNPLGARQLGYSASELIGRPLLGVIHESDRAAIQEHFDTCVAHLGRTQSWEARKVCKDGRTLWVRDTGKAVPRMNGTIVLLACEDITERKEVETAKERLQAQLRQSHKMEAMGTLAGGIAHDFNNILGAILGYGELAQQSVAETTDARRHIDNVMQAGGRAKSLVERILEFSRSGINELRAIDVQAVTEETLELLAGTSLPPGVSLETRLEAAGAAIVGDATQLHQVAMNLCTNAIQAMPRGGVLTVTLERAAVGKRRLTSHGTLDEGSYVPLSVSDTGTGISPAVLERMFDPFFTTKRVGDGTGLGLALVHGIVADFGGVIDVTTQMGVGTTFTIWLPAANQLPAPLAAPAGELPRGNGQIVMIVDDEPALVALAEETLADLGYEPVGFDSSLAALQAFRAQPQRFDLVLTDETMPDLTGIELAREMRDMRPEIPILLMSGHSGSQLSERAQDAKVIEVLRKPLVRRDIANPVARALSAPSAVFQL
jgi:PAS domain S-box-containing protein